MRRAGRGVHLLENCRLCRLIEGFTSGYCLRMPEELRIYLGQVFPRGILLPRVECRHDEYLVVGDTVTKNALKAGCRPRLLVFDCAEKRAETSCPEIPRGYVLREAKSPRSRISFEAWSIIEEALRKGGGTAIRVRGEEDLLALVVMLYAPQGSIVLYGQPNRGVVYVRVDREVKRRALNVLKRFRLEKC